MKIFLDSADLTEIRKWHATGIIDGITTNPSLLKKAGVTDPWKHISDIFSIVQNVPVSIQLMTINPIEMIKQAKKMSSIADNVVIKIPIVLPDGTPCFHVIKELSDDGINVNVTCCTSLGQGLLALKCGGKYISLLYGRMLDACQNANEVVRELMQLNKCSEGSGEILVASIRSISDIRSLVQIGTNIITVPPELLTKLCEHEYSKAIAQQFVDASLAYT